MTGRPPQAPYPRPVADWRDPDAYPAAKTPPVRWGWEFLRRNPEYQQAWDAFQTLPDTKDARRPAAARLERQFHVDYPIPYTEPAPDGWVLAPGFWGHEEQPPPWPVSLHPIEARHVEAIIESLVRFRALDATCTGGDRLRDALLSELRSLPLRLVYGADVEAEARADYIFAFDTARALTPQAKHLRDEWGEDFASGRDGIPNQQIEKWPVYLRILDADAAGAKEPDILASVYPGIEGGADRLRKARPQALELRDRLYWRLPT